MAMVKNHVIRESHNRQITAIGYHPPRREVFVGFEDGRIRSYDIDVGEPQLNLVGHQRGLISCFHYCARLRLLLSSSIDGTVAAWNAGGALQDQLNIGASVHCLAFNPKRHHLILGVSYDLVLYEIGGEHRVFHTQPVHTCSLHRDIVSHVLVHDGRVFSAGFDGQLILYDTSFASGKSISVIRSIKRAHEAGINAMIIGADADKNTWLITGSFDNTVKLWSLDGKLIHTLTNFFNPITGLAFVPRTKTLWVSASLPICELFEPKSGDRVSDFIGTFSSDADEDADQSMVDIIRYLPDVNQVVGTTSRRQIITWRYDSSSAFSSINSHEPLQSLCYTKKEPILIFTGDYRGTISKYERFHSNHYVYGLETMFISELEKKERLRRMRATLSLAVQERLQIEQIQADKMEERAKSAGAKGSKVRARPQSRYKYRKPHVDGVEKFSHPHTTILSMKFIDDLDLLAAASEDSCVYLWGFDADAMSALRQMENATDDAKSLDKYRILLGTSETDANQNINKCDDSVEQRVAGFSVRSILLEHTSCVTCLAVVPRSAGYEGVFLLSSGWDRRICLWDLEKGRLKDTFRNPVKDAPRGDRENIEIAMDAVATSLAFCAELGQFALATADGVVYLRRFSTDGDQMTLITQLRAHDCEVTSIQWFTGLHRWVTGSEDGTVRLWTEDGGKDIVLHTEAPVYCLCEDTDTGSLVVGADRKLLVYENEEFRLVQTNVGHADSIRDVIYLAERQQFITCSWDRTLRIWNSWRRAKRRPSQAPGQGGTQTAKESAQENSIPKIKFRDDPQDVANDV